MASGETTGVTKSPLLRVAGVLLVAPLLLSGCGGGSSSSSSSAPASKGPGGLPTGATGDVLCSALWASGTTMPSGVDSCAKSKTGNVVVPGSSEKCPDGKTLVSFGDYGWAFVGEKVHPLAKGKTNSSDPAYMSASQKCTGS